MDELPPRSLGAAANVVEWIRAEATLDGRLRRIRQYLENEGYVLPDPPRRVDRSEEGETHFVRGRPMTVVYSVVDQGGRKVYHYRENEIDHIMLNRVERDDGWALEHLPRIPAILRRGHVRYVGDDRVVYESREKFNHPHRRVQCVLWVIIRRASEGHWYVDTFFPRYPKR